MTQGAPGRQQSVIGNLPIEIIDGDRSSNYPKRDEFVERGIPFLNSTNISDDRIDPGYPR